jgi:hypothetical protein
MTMKKGAVCSAALLALVGTSALAAPNLTNVNQKGSLLVFPLIETQDGRDTIIFMSNDNTTYIDVKCYYGEFTGRTDQERWTPEQLKPTRDFQFRLTKNHPVIWLASEGLSPANNIDNGINVAVPPFPNTKTGKGQLVCWAVSEGGQKQVKFNHLSGMAKIIEPLNCEGERCIEERGQSWEYSAYSFYCRGGINGRGRVLEQCGDTEGVLPLDGKVYDKCGQYIIGQLIPEGASDEFGFGDNENFLAISSCTQDFSPVGYAEANFHNVIFDVWNGAEVKFTGAKDEVDGWWRIYLGPKGIGKNNNQDYKAIDFAGENLLYDTLKTAAAYYRLQSAGYLDEGELVFPGLVGVQVQYHDAVGYSATTVHHAGELEGEIAFKPQPDNPPERR